MEDYIETISILSRHNKVVRVKDIAKKLDEIVKDECGIIVYKNWVHLDVRTGKKYRKGV